MRDRYLFGLHCGQKTVWDNEKVREHYQFGPQVVHCGQETECDQEKVRQRYLFGPQVAHCGQETARDLCLGEGGECHSQLDNACLL